MRVDDVASKIYLPLSPPYLKPAGGAAGAARVTLQKDHREQEFRFLGLGCMVQSLSFTKPIEQSLA
jgi:hypothetical protein